MSNEQRSAADDEALSALLDGELGADEAHRLRQRLARDPVLAARLAVLEKANSTVRAAYAPVADEPLPERLVELLSAAERDDSDRGDPQRDNVVPLPKRSSRRIFAVPASLAAGIALAVGLVLGIALGPRMLAPDAARWAADAGVVTRGTALFDALQTLPSGESRDLGAGFAATARLTFAAAEGGYCRHIDLIGPRGMTAALACGGADGWRVETATFAPAAAGGPAGAYRPASGPDAALEAAIDERIDGAPLDAAAERELIEHRWANAAP